MAIEHFQDDDAGYLRWVDEHEADGYVLNRSRGGMSECRLHRASCWHVRHQIGGNRRWTREYVKDCSTSRSALVAWAAENGGAPVPCSLCGP